MSVIKSNISVLEDFQINVKLKLSALWVAVMFCYVYGDYIQVYVPGILAKAMEVEANAAKQVEFTVVAVLMAIPSLMIFFSLILKPKINRWLNIGLATFFIILNIMVNLSETWVFYLLLTAIETMINIAIVWYAWKWPQTSESLVKNV